MSDQGWREGVRDGLRDAVAYTVTETSAEVKLDANESPFSPPPSLSAAIAAELPSIQLNRYPDPSARELRQAIADDLGRPPDQLVLGNGSDELLALLCQTFAEPRPGARAAHLVYPGPTFVVYKTAALASGMVPVEAPLGPRFEPDEAALAAAIARQDPTLVFVATPNNPTGTLWPLDALARLARAHRRCVFLIDEAYVVYSGLSAMQLVDELPHVAILRTYSKIGLAGLRVGVLFARRELCAEVEKVRPPYNIASTSQRAATIAIRRFGPELVAAAAEVVRQREVLRSALERRPGVEVFDSAGNLLLIRVPDATRVWRGLLERGVVVRNFDRAGTPLAGCMRVTVGTATENGRFLIAFDEALAAR
jgi:histidinol-phosphate aminotransferase